MRISRGNVYSEWIFNGTCKSESVEYQDSLAWMVWSILWKSSFRAGMKKIGQLTLLLAKHITTGNQWDYNYRIGYALGRMKDGTSKTYTHTRGIGSFCTTAYSTSKSEGRSIATFGFYFTQEARLSSYP